MDTGLGKFAEISGDLFEEATEKNMSGIFREGEVLEIRGSKFVIHRIDPKKMILKLLSRDNNKNSNS